MKKTVIAAAVIAGIVLSPSVLSAEKVIKTSEVDNVSISLSDIKEALYGLLNNSKKNAEQIDSTKRAFERFKKYTNSINDDTKNKIKGLEREIEKNQISIKEINIKVEKNLSKIKKEEKRKIRYEKEMKEYIERNKELLPLEK